MNARIELWDTEVISVRQTFDSGGEVITTCFSTDSKLLASGSDGVWNVTSASLAKIILGHRSPKAFVGDFHNPGLMISASTDGIIKIWNPITWTARQTLDVGSHWSFGKQMKQSLSNDSRLLAFAPKRGSLIWDIASLAVEHEAYHPTEFAAPTHFLEGVKLSDDLK